MTIPMQTLCNDNNEEKEKEEEKSSMENELHLFLKYPVAIRLRH